jgi:hypothetical protein
LHTDGGLGHEQPAGRARHAAGIGDRDETAQGTQVEVSKAIGSHQFLWNL